MSLRRLFATAMRVLRQLGHDKRTIGLILVVPLVLMTLLKYVFDGNSQVYVSIAPIILGIFPFVIMFLITSISMLRERTTGTLERLMTMPIAKIDLLGGYALAFGIMAIIQGILASFVATNFLDVTVQSGTLVLMLVVLLTAVLGTSLGLLSSAFAKTEFQAVQFMPAFVFPQLLVCGLFVPREQMAKLLQWFSDIMPLTYAVDAMKQIASHTEWTSDLTKDLIIIAGYIIGALILSAATLRRRT